MLQTCVVDGKPHMQWQMLWPLVHIGRCYAKCGRWNTNVADVIATMLLTAPYQYMTTAT